MKFSHSDIDKLRKEAEENKEEYWEKIAEKLVWNKKWTSVADESEHPFTKWFTGGEMSLCYNCLDEQVKQGHGDKVGYIFDSPVTQTYKKYTFNEILDQVSRLAGVLLSLGVKRGDTVMLCFPAIPEGAFTMLACNRIGAVHGGIPNGISFKDIAQRIDHCKPKVLVIASHGYHASGWMNYKKDVDTACEVAKHKPKHVLVFQRESQETVSMLPGRDLDWKQEMSKAKAVGCVSMETNEPMFFVYTSGSTGEPKAVVHAGGTFAIRWIHDWTLTMGDAEDLVILPFISYGWVAGTMLTYGILLSGRTGVIFEGDCLLTEDERLLYNTLTKNEVTSSFLRPGIWKALKAKDPHGTTVSRYDFKRLETLYMGGERTDIQTLEWIANTFKVNVWNIYAQTESACIISGVPDAFVEPPGVYEFGMVNPGIVLKVVDEEGKELGPHQVGRVLIKQGVSPTSFITLLNDRETYMKKYFTDYPGYLDTMDNGSVDEKGFLRIENRADDMMKVGLHYVTSQAIEEIAMKQKSIVESVVVSVTDLHWKEIPVTLYVKNAGSNESAEEIEKEVHDMVHRVFGDTLMIGRLVQVKELPITRTGKLHRPSCRDMVRGKDVQATSAVENPQVFPDIKSALRDAGYGKKDVLLH